MKIKTPGLSGKKALPSFAHLLNETKRIQYIDKDIVVSVIPHQPQKIEFFTIGKYVTCEELEKEYKARGLVPAHPYALVLYSLENEAEIEKMVWVATQWKKQRKGEVLCYLTFDRWGGNRGVNVYRNDDSWGDDWWFAGVREPSALGEISPLAPLPSDLPIEIKIGGEVYKGNVKRQ